VYLDFYSLLQAPFYITDFQGRKRSLVWRFGLAPAVAMALLGGLLWLAPWRGLHDAPRTAPQASLAQGGDRTAEQAGKLAATPGQVPAAKPNEAKQDTQSPALLLQNRDVSGGVLAQQPHPDIQAIQEPVTRPEPTGRTHEEHLDTQGMANLLAKLEPADKTTVPTAPRSKAAKRRSTRSPLRAPAGRGLPSSAVSPRRTDAVPARPAPGLRFSGDPNTHTMSPRRAEAVPARPAPEFQFFKTDDPRFRRYDSSE
jgi:hypothetical protein